MLFYMLSNITPIENKFIKYIEITTKIWRLNNLLLNNGIKFKIKKYLNINEKKNTTAHCLWDVAKLFSFPSCFFKYFIDLGEREQERASKTGGRSREREEEEDSPLSREPDMRLDPRTMRS